jgi:hypothetical protein
VKGAANGAAVIETAHGRLQARTQLATNAAVLVAIRPEYISLLGDGAPTAENEISAIVRDRVYLGGQIMLTCEVEAPDRLLVVAPEKLVGSIEAGSRLRLWLPADHLIVLPAAT